MTIDWWTLGIQTVNVVVLVWLLRRFFWRPVAAMIAERRATTEKTLADANASRDEAAAGLSDVAKTRTGFGKERDDILAAAHVEADKARAAAMDGATKDAAALHAAAQASIDQGALDAEAAWSDRASRLAVDIAGRLAARLQGPAVSAVFLDWLTSGIRALPQAARDDAGPVEAVSAQPLAPAEQERYRTSIAEAFGSHPQVTFAADPALIAGIELRGPHFIVGNSWRADLATILGELRHAPDGSGPDDWLAAARAKAAAASLGARAEQVGRVEEVGDGVALVSGLPGVRLDELLRFERGQFGFAQSLERDRVGCVLLDDVDGVQAGDAVRGTGDVVRTRIGDALLGRVVDPLGRPLDGKGPVATEAMEPIERPAPSIIDRDLVVQPVQTGLLVVDTLFALGRGQRELIIGDRAIGKTTIGVDAIISQKGGDIVCVYVAVGQRSSSVRRVIDALEAHGALARCIVVVAEAAGSPGLQWIAPFAAFTMAEHFRDRGGHALIVVDDLTKHAATHREIALLTRQSPGREAYPGDVFYVHARLLERAAKLSAKKGGGSLTALPIAETDAGNLSAYIPTNLISITDGQIVLDANLFHQGQKPAVDVGLSVSRVGAKTQAHALRDAAKTLRLDYAQFLELETFTRFGGMPDARVRGQLARGARIRMILNQPQHLPLDLADQVALVLAVQSGVLDALPPPAVEAFRQRLRAAIEAQAADAVRQIEATGELDEAGRAALLGALKTCAAAVAPPAAA